MMVQDSDHDLSLVQVCALHFKSSGDKVRPLGEFITLSLEPCTSYLKVRRPFYFFVAHSVVS